MELLIKHGDFVKFFIEFEEGDFEGSATFDVFEVTGWESDYSPSEIVQYLHGKIKFDGCSDIKFPDTNEIHLCGKRDFKYLKDVLDAIWDVCSKKIIYWDDELANVSF